MPIRTMPGNLSSINDEQKLYCLRESGGFTCLGFDVARDRTLMYLRAIGHSAPDPMPYGTAEAYEFYLQTESAYIQSPASNGTTFDPNTPDKVKTALEIARANHTRVRLFYGDTETGRDWHEENDVTGYIGRSMGPIKAPILIPNERSSGGPAILTACILKIIETNGGRVLYRHPKYEAGKYEIRPAVSKGYESGVWIDGELHAQFKGPKGEEKARRWVQKMTGNKTAA